MGLFASTSALQDDVVVTYTDGTRSRSASELTAHSAIVPMYWSKAAVMFVVCGGYGGTPSLQWRRGLGMRATTGSDGTEPRWMSFL